jgi:ABC-type protease/lipase transport system fused ATPase/permease subunit
MIRVTLERFDSLDALRRWTARHSQARERASERPQLERKLGALERKFRKSLDQAARGIISLDKMRAISGELMRESQIMKRRLALLEAEERDELTETEREEYLLARIREIRERWGATTITAMKPLLQDVIERIIVYDDGVQTLFRV